MLRTLSEKGELNRGLSELRRLEKIKDSWRGLKAPSSSKLKLKALLILK